MQIKNVTLSATTETEITIEQGYPYVWFKNLGDNTVYVSASPDILDNGSVKTEGVSTVTSGECTSVTTKSDKVYAYALGATIVEVHAQGNPESSFKIKAKGGESSVTVEPILITHNGEYTAPEGKAYSPVNVQTPVYNITPLTLTHNHQGAEAGLYGGYSPVQVDIEMDTLNAPSNGVYEIDTTTQDGWDTVLVDTYEKYNELFFSSGNNYSPQEFSDNIFGADYSELWIVGFYAYSTGTGNHTSLWCSRYPIEIAVGTVGCSGEYNPLWLSIIESGAYATTSFADYDNPYMYIGIKNKDREQDTLWQSTESTTPSTITLSGSIFDYDEVCFFMAKSDGKKVASWYLTSELEIGDTICGHDDTNQSTYTIASNTTLTVGSEDGYRLYAVYGVNDSSMTKTTLYNNTSGTMPASITLSDAYTSYDELVFVGHTSGGIVCEQYYPVMTFGRRTYARADDRIQISTYDLSSWFTLTSSTTLSVDDDRIIVDKIIGIKRPVISTAHELIDVVPLTANSNGTYTAPTGTAYSPVVVDVQEQPWQPLQDGYSNFWFELTDDTLSPWLNFSAKNADATIDWGDGSGEQALDTLTPTHTYSKAGKYVVKVKGVTRLAQQFPEPYNSAYIRALIGVELNSEVETLGNNFLRLATGLKNFCFSNPNGIRALGTGIFNYCAQLVSVVIPNTITSINANMYANCILLKSVTIGSATESIGQRAFSGCILLSEIHVLATTPPTVSSNTFDNLPSDYIIYVPVGTGETYKAAAGWSAYSDHILEEGQTVTKAMLSRLAKADGDIVEAEKNEADEESSDMR